MPAALRGDTAIYSYQFASASRLIGVALALLLPLGALAEDVGPSRPFVERGPWQEQALVLPPYPDGTSYLAVPVRVAGSRLELFIEPTSLTVGRDGVVRYVLLLRAPSGSENLFYEGIRCSARAWRTYAYGGNAGDWRLVEDRAWAPLRDLGVDRYRERLYRYYLCDPAMGNLSRTEILRRLRHGPPGDE
ncbi:MAG: CNP1-like family protein [Gammaproteobacteria bacterium]